jgi:hypothetical protein
MMVDIRASENERSVQKILADLLDFAKTHFQTPPSTRHDYICDQREHVQDLIDHLQLKRACWEPIRPCTD